MMPIKEATTGNDESRCENVYACERERVCMYVFTHTRIYNKHIQTYDVCLWASQKLVYVWTCADHVYMYVVYVYSHF
jgi:hypothetical protein